MKQSSVNWANPYTQRDGVWLKGNLHTHTSPASACGMVSLAETLDGYARAGYDFLAISDHMTHTEARDDRMILLPGIEWNRPDGGGHTGLYAEDPACITPHLATTDQEALLAALAPTPAIVILNHPDWQPRPHYLREELRALNGYTGIEIFNGVIKRLEGCEISTTKWDDLLTHGKRVLGFASDDFHQPADLGQGWNVVRAADRTPTAIFAALTAGNCYASSGVTLTDIRRDGDLLTVESLDGQEIRATGAWGVVLQTVFAPSMTIDAATMDTPYLRFTVHGHGSAMAWTQPFFLGETE